MKHRLLPMFKGSKKYHFTLSNNCSYMYLFSLTNECPLQISALETAVACEWAKPSPGR